jgi:hypothetical protein
MNKIITKWKNWIVRKQFERHFGNFIYPFLRADEELSKMDVDDRLEYLRTVKVFIKSSAYKTEMECLIRTLYQELAIKPLKEPEFTGYRLSLMFAKNMQKRLEYLSARYEQEEATADKYRSFKN